MRIRVGRLTPGGGFSSFPVTSYVTNLAYGPDGNLWYSAGADVGVIGSNGAPQATYTLPTVSGAPTLAGPLVAGGDGNVWVIDLSYVANSSLAISALAPCSVCNTPQRTTATTLAAGGYPASVTSDGTNVYFTNFWGGGSVESVPRMQGPAVAVAANRHGPWGLAVDGTNAYWTENNAGNGQIAMTPKAGGGAVTLIATSQGTPRGIALSGSYVYWANNAASGNGGGIFGAPTTASGAVSAFGPPQEYPFSVIATPSLLGGDYLLWTDNGSGARSGSVMEWTPPSSSRQGGRSPRRRSRSRAHRESPGTSRRAPTVCFGRTPARGRS